MPSPPVTLALPFADARIPPMRPGVSGWHFVVSEGRICTVYDVADAVVPNFTYRTCGSQVFVALRTGLSWLQQRRRLRRRKHAPGSC